MMVCLVLLGGCASLDVVESQQNLQTQPMTLLVFQAPFSNIKADLEIITPTKQIHRVSKTQWKPRRVGAGYARFPSIKTQGWFGVEGNYTFRFSKGGNSKQIIQYLDGTEHSFEMAIRFDEENGVLKRAEFFNAFRILPSPKTVYFSSVKYDAKNGSAGAYIYNESSVDIHGANPDGTMYSVIQVKAKGGWVNYQTSHACFTMESFAVVKSGEKGWFGNPDYYDSTPLMPGKYRIVSRYVHIPFLVRAKKQPQRQKHYQLSREFIVQ